MHESTDTKTFIESKIFHLRDLCKFFDFVKIPFLTGCVFRVEKLKMSGYKPEVVLKYEGGQLDTVDG